VFVATLPPAVPLASSDAGKDRSSFTMDPDEGVPRGIRSVVLLR
jgi:hypothetical protein